MGILKVTTVGNSVGVILPKEILERLRVKKGDSLYVIETKNDQLPLWSVGNTKSCGKNFAVPFHG
jgi:putative addiction module antidote